MSILKAPVSIYEEITPVSPTQDPGTRIDFLYNASKQRSVMFYGSDDIDRENRPLRKLELLTLC